ncbi:synaptotagmin-like protein 4 isoform X2 [Nerophis lumbriciformis]|uniref:synaptotagmin-like protein 4 isoform X2 n=1 Tax=Nerophis lumbriciformis TaxID=546530 RepID=UPI002ADFB5F8|nr:synaptotagmin-like protein 4 isoform X2 [Nerophis lumbriciformis]
MLKLADNIDLGFLSDSEREAILEVLRRDEDLRKAEEQRVLKLKAELLGIKRKGAKRGSGRYSQRSCGRCQTPLSPLALNSIQCRQCHHLVCSQCRTNVPRGEWLCNVCAKESDLRKSTGDWFYNLRVNRFFTLPAHELVRRSLRKKPVSKKYETIGDVLLKNEDLSQAASTLPSEDLSAYHSNAAEIGSSDPPRPQKGQAVENGWMDASTLPSEDLSRTASTLPSEDLSRAASTLPSEDLSRAAPTLPSEDLSRAASTLPSEDLSRAAPTLPSEDLSRAASTLPSEDLSRAAPTLPSEDLSRASSTLPSEDLSRAASVPVPARNPTLVAPAPTPALIPIPIPRQRIQTTSKRPPSKNSGSMKSFEIEVDEDTSKPPHSDTESAEKGSLGSSRTGTESRRVTPDLPSRQTTPRTSSPAGSSVSSLTLQVIPDAVSIHSSSSEANIVPEIRQASPSLEFDVDKLFKKSVKNLPQSHNIPERFISEPDVCDQPDSGAVQEDIKSHSVHGVEMQVPEIKPVSPSPAFDVEQIFKRSVRRVQNPPGHLSTLDLRGRQDTLEVPFGNRSRSVPALDMHEDEDEDIDSLVNFHRSTMVSSSESSKSTHGSLMSIYSESGDHDSVEVSGEVVFSMTYDQSSQSLQVFIKECRGLACGDPIRQLSNPYVKCYLLPDKSRMSKRKSTIKRHTCDPVYNETFKYSIGRSQLFTRSLLLSVWHHGRLSRNPFLGEVEMALDCYDLDSPQEERMALMTGAPCSVPASAFSQFKGELVISLKYVTPKAPVREKMKGKKTVAVEGGELHILIKEARNLMAMKGGGGTSDSFVKGYLFPSKSKTTKRKTPVVKRNLNPHYGHTFVYKDLALEQLKTMCLELTVWDREPMLSNEFLGGVRLSSGKGTVKIGSNEVDMDSLGEEVSLWQKMMQYPDSWAEGSLPLRTTMRQKKGK